MVASFGHGFGVGFGPRIPTVDASTPFDELPVLGVYRADFGVTRTGNDVTAWAPWQGTGTWTNATADEPQFTEVDPSIAFTDFTNRRLVGDATVRGWGSVLGDGISCFMAFFYDHATTGSLCQLGRGTYNRLTVDIQPANRTLAASHQIVSAGASNAISLNNSLPAAAGWHTFAFSYDGTAIIERYWVDAVSQVNGASAVSGAYAQSDFTAAFLGSGEFNDMTTRLALVAFINGPLSDAEVTLLHEYTAAEFAGIL